MQCRHPGSQAKAAAASSNREGKEKMKNDDFLWEKSGIEVEAAQKILYIFAVNATLSKKERETSTISISKVGN